jgi:prephenate dehydrogenase
MKRVTIVGLGLIGGSIALSLRMRGVWVVGADKLSVLTTELCAQSVDERVDVADDVALADAAKTSDLVVLAAPVRVNIALLPAVLGHARVVMDTGSTKRAIVSAANATPHGGRFVASHPMAGRAQSGLAAASPELFEGRPWIVCSDEPSAPAPRAVEELIHLVGGVVVHMTAEEHDRAVALTSHVPQLLASALAALAHERGATRAGGPAFERATRTAGGDEAMWRDVFTTNGDEVAAALRQLGAELLRLADALGQSPPDVAQVMELLERARRVRSEH